MVTDYGSFEWPPTGASSGFLTSINGDNAAAQLLTVGTAGTDFAIVDAGSGSHVFNLPSASASNRGALTAADWTTFNSKQGAVSIGALDAQAENANGLALVASVLSSQSADATHPGMVNITTQTFAGNKTFTGNVTANNHVEGYTTTVTAAGNTTLTVSSTYQQFFTGSSTQTVILPVTSTLAVGWSFNIVNNATGTVTVNSSGSNLVLSMMASTSAIITCILTSGTTAASWSVSYQPWSLNANGVNETSYFVGIGTNNPNGATLNVAATGNPSFYLSGANGSNKIVMNNNGTQWMGIRAYGSGGGTALGLGYTSNITTNITDVLTILDNGNVTALGTLTASNLSGTNTGNVTLTAVGSSPSANGASLSGQALTLQPADATNPGLVTTGSQSFGGTKTFTSPIVGTQSQGDSSTKAASTSYVDVAIANAIAGVNPAVAVQAATTAASDTSGFTYNNGASGIGAFFTGSVNTSVTIDGYTFTALGQRLLVKNDTQSPSGAFNGVYYVTQVQTAILAPIFTRALDYDMPSDMNNTGAIPVINGTVNGTTSWVLTSLVVTVGTTPLTFVKFTRNPADYLLVANNLSDVSTKATAFNNVSPVTSTGDLIVGNGSNSNTRLAVGTQYQVAQATATTVAYDAVHLDQAAAVTGILPNANTTAVSTNTASKIVTRDGSGNFSAGTITATLTGTASGNLQATANNHGMLVSGSGNTVTVIAPDASTTKVWTSGGSSADPSWQNPSASGSSKCWSGYHLGNTSGWTTNSGTYADPSGGSGSSLTEVNNSGMGTVTTAGSSLPGLSLTWPTTGLYYISVRAGVGGGASQTTGTRLVAGSTVVIDPGCTTYNISGSGGEPYTAVVQGLYSATAGADTIKLQFAAPGTAVGIINQSALATTGSAQIMWTIIQM